MILSFRHKGLRRLFEDDDGRGVRADQLARLRRVLFLLDGISMPTEANLPGHRLHALAGDLNGYWAISVSGNWRVIFRMLGSDVADVDLTDYH